MPRPSNRIINLHGTIETSMYTEFSNHLRILENQSKAPVIIDLLSEGGDVHSAFAIYDRLQESSVKFHVIGRGLVASAAVLILVGGDKRYLSKNAWVMVHEESGEFSGNVTLLEKETSQLRAMETQWNDLMQKHTSVPKETWAKMHKDTTYLSAKECLALRMIDGVL